MCLDDSVEESWLFALWVFGTRDLLKSYGTMSVKLYTHVKQKVKYNLSKLSILACTHD